MLSMHVVFPEEFIFMLFMHAEHAGKFCSCHDMGRGVWRISLSLEPSAGDLAHLPLLLRRRLTPRAAAGVTRAWAKPAPLDEEEEEEEPLEEEDAPAP